MNKFAAILALCSVYSMCHAQSMQDGETHLKKEISDDKEISVEPETIISFIANHHETEWYAQQAKAWQKKVDENPQEQWAWRNLFLATYYYDAFTGFGSDWENTETAKVIRKMEDAIPDSFVLNLCKSRFCLNTDTTAQNGECLYRAIELMPADAIGNDVNDLYCRLWCKDPTNSKIKELSILGFKKQVFPQRIMQYNRNMLASMLPNAICFSNGDAITAPMKILQDALGERTDITVIPKSFLCDDNFRESIFKTLNIPTITFDITSYAEKYHEECYAYYTADIIKHIIHESKRPVYFSPNIITNCKLDKDSIYNEGLLLKYSDTPYDNFSVAMDNVKNKYHLEYLAEPNMTYTSWDDDMLLDVNNIVLLGHLVGKLRKNGDLREAERLYRILKTCLERSSMDPNIKQHLQQQLEADSK